MIFSWGANNKGQLGLGFSSEQVTSPQLVKMDESVLFEDELQKIVSGGCFTHFIYLAKKEENKTHRQLKMKSFGTESKIFVDHINNLTVNDSIKFNSFISAGWDFCVATIGATILMPNSNDVKNVKIFNDTPPVYYNRGSAGLRHFMVISNDGNLYAYGDNSKGQLGLDLVGLRNVDTLTEVIIGDTPLKIVNVKCGQNFTIVLDENGKFHGAGQNKFGQLGFDPTTNDHIFHEFTEMTNIKIDNVSDFACGWNHVLVLQKNGQILSWGRNNFGQLGRTTANDKEFDEKPAYVCLNEKVKSIAVGSEHNLALTTSGHVYAWGWNEHYNCGIESSSKEKECVMFPTLIPGLNGISNIFCGAGNGFASTS